MSGIISGALVLASVFEHSVVNCTSFEKGTTFSPTGF